MATCRNGHALSKVGMVWTGTHYQCRECRRASTAAASQRWNERNPGHATAIRTRLNALRSQNAHQD